jgi:DNA-binding CsgD family transcriptional regulator
VTEIPRGRRRECERLDELLAAVRAGRSAVLAICGDPGVGKTVLLEYLRNRADGCRVVRAIGIESEMELPFAGLHQLCAPLLDRLGRLPEPQRDALSIAFGLSQGAAPDRFFVGLAVLSLLSDAAEEAPLVVCVDDAQWLDGVSAQALGFVARRLQADPVAVVFATRVTTEALERLPELVVRGLPEADARAVLAAAVHGPLDERVRDRIVSETGGNPLALTELPRGLEPAQLAGGFALPHQLGLSGRIEDSFLRRIDSLGDDTRRLLLLAASDPVGDPALVWRAAAKLAIGPDAAGPAEEAELLRLGATVRFRHPLVRSAIYRGATPAERRAVHRALADATDLEADPDRRAWHRAHAAEGFDEDVARELERSAGRALDRGGLAAAAAFLERAAGLTPDPGRRAARELAAAEAKLQAGAFGESRSLLAAAEAGPLDEHGRARAQLLLGRLAFAVQRGREAPPLLLAAAKRLEPLDLALARETYLDAFLAAVFADNLSAGGDAHEVAEAVRAAPRPPEPLGTLDLLLDGLALLVTEGQEAASAPLHAALAGFLGDDLTREQALRWMLLASHAGVVIWDSDRWFAICRRQLQLFRDAGELSMLPFALNGRACTHLFTGELAEAVSLLDELRAVTDATGIPAPPYGAIAVPALQGREAETRAAVDANMGELVARGEGIGVSLARWGLGMLYNGLGRYEDAIEATRPATEDPRPLGVASWAGIELIEAAVRHGDHALAARTREAFSGYVGASDWGLGVDARSRALLAEDDGDPEPAYVEAIERLDRGGVHALRARTQLLYGEWLRRHQRRRDAREHLRAAYDSLTAMGLAAFAERAARELRAAGATAMSRGSGVSSALTPREAEIARLAGEGLSNTEIGTRLFISPRTVEYHLHKVFGKLGIGGRNELARALAPLA